MLRQGKGVASRHATGNDRDLVNRILGVAVERRNSMPRLVIGGELFLLFGNHLGALLGACYHLDGGVLNVLLDDGLPPLPGSQ